jgi:hypothetical protein
MPDPGLLIVGAPNYVAQHYGAVFSATLLELCVSLGLAWGAHAWLASRYGAPLRNVSAWKRVFREDAPTNTDVHVRVKLTNGTVFTGMLAHYTPDLDVSAREIVLAPPLCSRTGTNTLSVMPAEWTRLVISGSEIESIAVRYVTR